jgi:hypothetical protein
MVQSPKYYAPAFFILEIAEFIQRQYCKQKYRVSPKEMDTFKVLQKEGV